jgi:AAA+ superfamily predicted ATPase
MNDNNLTMENENYKLIESDLIWFENWIQYCLQVEGNEISHPGFPVISNTSTPYGDFCRLYLNDQFELLIFICGLAVTLKPQIFDPLMKKLQLNQGINSEIGGIITNEPKQYIPNGDTLCYMFSDGTLEERLEIMERYQPDSNLFDKNLLKHITDNDHINYFSQGFKVTQESLDLITKGYSKSPDFSTKFPAVKISGNFELNDLILSKSVIEKIKIFTNWINNENTIIENAQIKKIIKPGFKVIFHGPSGTGKTETAKIIGKETNRDVYRINSSHLVSKYIGETEKNIENIFKQAANKNWILFFDEAESLFSKRNTSSQGSDKYANQQVGFLLQKIEDFEGVCILSTNLKHAMDEAFLRRFHLFIYFEKPDYFQREEIWKRALGLFTDDLSAIKLNEISKKYDLTAAQIHNSIKIYNALSFDSTQTKQISQTLLEKAIDWELKKSQ